MPEAQTLNQHLNPTNTQPGYLPPKEKREDVRLKDVRPIPTTPLNSFKTILILGGILILLWIIIKIYEAVNLSTMPDLTYLLPHVS
jgi:hypothetical protein